MPRRATRKSGGPADSAVPPSDRVRAEWLRRVEAEYRSAAITQHFTLWLIQIGAPPDLIADGLRIVGDEMKHAELSHVVFGDAGGSGAPRLERETLGLKRRRNVPLEVDVLRYGVDVFCLGETVAVRLFKRLRSRCRVESARKALDRILRDEVRHRDFGWTTLEWLLETPHEPMLRKALAEDLPGMLRRVRQSYGGVAGSRQASETSEADFSEDDRAWGLMATSEYRDAVAETFARDYAPRFENLDVEMPA